MVCNQESCLIAQQLVTASRATVPLVRWFPVKNFFATQALKLRRYNVRKQLEREPYDLRRTQEHVLPKAKPLLSPHQFIRSFLPEGA